MKYNNNPAEVITIGKPYIGQIISKPTQTEYAEFHELFYGYRAVFVLINIFLQTTCTNVRELLIKFDNIYQNEEEKYMNYVKLNTGLEGYTPVKASDKEIIKKIAALLIHKKTGGIPNQDFLERGWNEREVNSYI